MGATGSGGIPWANPPFSKLGLVATKVALEGGKLVLCHPDWMGGGNGYWRQLVDHLTVKRVPLPASPLYIPDNSPHPLPSPV